MGLGVAQLILAALAAISSHFLSVVPAWAEAAASCGLLPEANGEWPTSSPAAAGLDEAILYSINDRLDKSPQFNVLAVVVTRGGKLVYESYRKGEDFKDGVSLGVVPHSPQQLHDVRSISKSVVSLLIGIALDRKFIASVDAPVSSFFPNLQNPARPEKPRIELRHLVTMTSGLRGTRAMHTAA